MEQKRKTCSEYVREEKEILYFKLVKRRYRDIRHDQSIKRE